jgi:hypothetical protein
MNHNMPVGRSCHSLLFGDEAILILIHHVQTRARFIPLSSSTRTFAHTLKLSLSLSLSMLIADSSQCHHLMLHVVRQRQRRLLLVRAAAQPRAISFLISPARAPVALLWPRKLAAPSVVPSCPTPVPWPAPASSP